MKELRSNYLEELIVSDTHNGGALPHQLGRSTGSVMSSDSSRPRQSSASAAPSPFKSAKAVLERISSIGSSIGQPATDRVPQFDGAGFDKLPWFNKVQEMAQLLQYLDQTQVSYIYTHTQCVSAVHRKGWLIDSVTHVVVGASWGRHSLAA